MSTYTIGEAAGRSGFSTSALRYYERIGLLPPAGRTRAGYRVYDDRTLDRLTFIARAKELGCSLEEVTDLVAIWDGEPCGPVQRRLHELVSDKIRAAERQASELDGLTAQLRAAAAQLGGEPVDGPCGDDCACVAAPPAVPPAAPEREPADVSVACTLEPLDVPGRLAEWQTVLECVRARSTKADGTLRLELTDGVDLGDLARLVAAEQRCCAFFSFAITMDGRGAALEVRAPDGAADVVASLFGEPA